MWINARNESSSLPYRVATRLDCFSLRNSRSNRLPTSTRSCLTGYPVILSRNFLYFNGMALRDRSGLRCRTIRWIELIWSIASPL